MSLDERFGRFAEGLARTLGTPRFLIGQTLVVAVWIAANLVLALRLRWDPYPFILLNLAFSTQAAYAAPLILLAQNRQADRDRAKAEQDLALDERDLRLDTTNLAIVRQVRVIVAATALGLGVCAVAGVLIGSGVIGGRRATSLPRVARPAVRAAG